MPPPSQKQPKRPRQLLIRCMCPHPSWARPQLSRCHPGEWPRLPALPHGPHTPQEMPHHPHLPPMPRTHAHTHSDSGAGEVPQVGSHHQWGSASGGGQARESASPPWPQPRPRASRAHVLAASSYPLLSGAPAQWFCHSRWQQTLYTEQPLLPRWAGTQDTVRGALSWKAGVQQQLWSPCTL